MAKNVAIQCKSFPIDQVADGNSVDKDAVVRLKTAVDLAGGQTAVARKSGIPLSTLKSYQAGRELRSSSLVALAKATDVSLEWLATGEGPMRPGEMIASHSIGGMDRPATAVDHAPQPAVRYVPIPRFNIAAAAGGGTTLTDHPQVVEHIAFEEEFLRRRLRRRPEDLGLIEARGDSMEPTIRDGDILTVDLRQDQPVENGRLYVIRVGDMIVVKRIEVRISGLVLHSDNTRYSPETIDRADLDQLHVVGHVLLVTAPPR